ncbi:hypothetical protein Tco_0746026, partial [Tanacetum coccineum]
MAPMECHKRNMHGQDKVQTKTWEMRDRIGSCWKDLSAWIEHGKSKTSGIISKLWRIERLLTELPASKRAQIETSFSRLYREADIVMNAIMNSMKIQSDEKQNRLSIYFHELATKVLQTIPAEVKKYLLEGSPSATFTEVSYE